MNPRGIFLAKGETEECRRIYLELTQMTLYTCFSLPRTEEHPTKARCVEKRWSGVQPALTLAILLIVSLSALADVVDFPDPGLEAAIRDAIGRPTGDILDSDLVGLEYLDASSRSISDLEGIQHCTDLTSLNLGGNQIVDVSPLSGLTDLTVLWLWGNQISNLGPLSGLVSLEELNLWSNQISSLGSLSGMSNLQELWLGSNLITDLGSLAGLTSLVHLNLANNQIVGISALSGLTNLTILTLSANQIVGISPLSGLTNLTELYLDSNQIVNISALSGLTSLVVLILDFNQITDISALSELTNLLTLWLDDNSISDFSVLSGMVNLLYLTLNFNSITDVSFLSTLSNLKELWLYGNSITDFGPLVGLTNLTRLQLSRNGIVDISLLSSLTSLTHLYLHTNQIADIRPLSGLTNLVSLYLYSNQIIDIAPLVDNAGIGGGDDVDVRWNHLDLAPGSADMDNINTLLARGVSFQYDPQKSAAVFRVDAGGNVLADQTFHSLVFETGSADIAEWVAVSAPTSPGDVIEIDPEHPSAYRMSRSTCSSLVAGVSSTAPGVTLGGRAWGGQALLALVGIVPVKVTNEGGPILPGDLLVASSTPGHAMRWAGSDPCPCSLVGKALEPMTDKRGVIPVLLTTH
jgi:Leucine-rich repeat (LRR) protein